MRVFLEVLKWIGIIILVDVVLGALYAAVMALIYSDRKRGK